MRSILNVALNDLRVIFRERASIILNLIVIPLVISFAAGGANSSMGGGGDTAAPDLLIDVIDASGSAESAAFLDVVRSANENVLLCPLDNTADNPCALPDGVTTVDETLAGTRLEEQTSLALILIPEDFSEMLNAGTARVVYRSNEDASAPGYLLSAVETAAQQIGGAVEARTIGLQVADDIEFLTFADDADRAGFGDQVYARAAEIWATNPITVNATAGELELSSAAFNGFSQSFPGIATMYAMFAVFPVMVALIDERRYWTLQRLAMMPIRRSEILGGKLLARFLMGMIQYAIVFAVGLVIGVPLGDQPLATVLIMVSFVFCVTALALMVSTFMKTSQQASGIALFMSLTLAPLGGAWWPLDIVPSWMRTIGHVSPVAWAMDGYSKIIFSSGTLVDVLPMIGVLLAMGAVFFLIGVSRFKFE